MSGFKFWGIYGYKGVIIVAGVGIRVREAGTIGGGRDMGVDRWAVRGIFKAKIRACLGQSQRNLCNKFFEVFSLMHLFI